MDRQLVSSTAPRLVRFLGEPPFQVLVLFASALFLWRFALPQFQSALHELLCASCKPAALAGVMFQGAIVSQYSSTF
jgi:hypothetical protein